MKFDKITVQPLYPTGSFTNIRIGVDMSLEGNDDPKAAMKAAIDLANEFHKEQFPKLYDKEGKPLFGNYAGEDVPEVQQEKKPDIVNPNIEAINNCQTLDELKEFWMLSKSNLNLAHAYKTKENILKNASIQK